MKMNFLEYGLGKGNQFWKYVIVMVLAWVIGAGLLGAIPLVIVMVVQTILTDGDWSALDNMDFQALGISLNMGLFLLLFTFVMGLLVFLGLIWLMHNGRTYKETINGTKKIRWNRVWVGVWSWGALMAVSQVVGYFSNPSNFVFQFDIVKFIPLLIITLLFIPLQTSFEELTFRGYLAQGLAGLTKSRWVAFLVPSILFGLMHMANPEVAEHGFWIMMPYYIIAGLVWGLISILDDGIELALGAHAINNVLLCLFFTNSSSALQTYAMFEIVEINPVRSLIAISLYSIILITFLAWKYKWDFSLLNKRIEKNKEVGDSEAH